MTDLGRTALAAAAAALVFFSVATMAEESVIEGHDFMTDEKMCADCHAMVIEDGEPALYPDQFVTIITDLCVSCHPSRLIGRSHPVGMDPLAKLPLNEMPPELPLQWSDDQLEDIMTCATCHNPHLERFSEEKLFKRQRSWTNGLYLTYFLRIKGADVSEGFTPLCHACHPDL